MCISAGLGTGLGTGLGEGSMGNVDIVKILIDLYNKYEKLEAEHNELKKYVQITKNKINIIDYLNQNCVIDYVGFNEFINNIKIGDAELEIIFKKDYVDGICEIFSNYINGLNELDKRISVKAFSNKDGILYIYRDGDSGDGDGNMDGVGDMDEDGKWCVMTEEYLNKFIRYFDKKILKKFLEWKTYNAAHMDYELYSELFILNMKKVIGGNFENKNKNKKMMIKNRIYKFLKVNLKNVVSYEFE